MPTRDVAYVVDGREFVGRLAVPGGTGRRPAVLVCHEGSGLDRNAISRAERLAELGYLAFALDYHGGGKALPLDQAMPLLQSLMEAPERIRAIAGAALEVLLAHERADVDRVAAIGYCFGGTMSLELARAGAPLKAVVGLHSGLTTSRPEDAKNIKGKVLVCIGDRDPLVPAEQRAAFEQEMRDAGVDWQMHLYGEAAHSFTNPDASTLGMPGVEYHEPSDRRSWKAMLDFLEETIGRP